MHYGIVRTSSDARHVPELRKNLISLGVLDSNGCSYRAAGGVLRIMKGALIVMKGLKKNSLYLLQGSIVTGAAATASSSDIDSDTTKLWHMRLGHMSERGMDVLSNQGLLGSKKTIKLDFCEHCVFGKQCRVKFSHDVHTTKDEEDGYHSTEENEEPQGQQYSIAINISRRKIRPPQKSLPCWLLLELDCSAEAASLSQSHLPHRLCRCCRKLVAHVAAPAARRSGRCSRCSSLRPLLIASAASPFHLLLGISIKFALVPDDVIAAPLYRCCWATPIEDFWSLSLSLVVTAASFRLI
ncbi:hypothetical protein RJ640_003619 [Escallonia rubra]|uniref:GAG-pre-integrase domain-containing protein n=1 Tax=Escallonia rubra TaxID=112253 RepID=A0AA88U401_9ASTE|nr:hypothetical protein RJ640_003619 [Escallonia rubra]